MRFLLALILSLLPSLGAAQAIDYNIANQTFPSFRTDLNNHLSAIVQQNAGTVAPATTFPYMVWADTSGAAPIIRYRNAANSGWAAAFRIDPSATMWLGGITTASATITGGSINGTAIGGTIPASGTFTTLRSTSGAPGVFLRETDTATTHNVTWIVQDANTLLFQTRNDADTFVSQDYAMAKNASGAVSHSWSVGNVERMGLTGGLLNLGVIFRQVEGGWNELTTIWPRGNSNDLGTDNALFGNRWRFIYLQFAPNVSSDARLKRDIGDVAEAECRAADRIEIRRYRMTAEPDGPWHFGAIAQEVIAAFEAEGLDWQDYAIVTGSEADTYGVVYDELQSLKLACM